jgi:hypothetical protein
LTATLKNPFNPINLKPGVAQAGDVNRVEDLIRAAFDRSVTDVMNYVASYVAAHANSGTSSGGTLASVYAAGLAAPTVDNVFGQANGNTRFQGGLGEGDVQFGYYERNTGLDDQQPASYIQKYFPSKSTERRYAHNAAYFPSWDSSTYSQLDGIQLDHWLASVTASSTEAYDHTQSLQLGQESLYAWSFPGGDPVSYPQPSPTYNDQTLVQWKLYSNLDSSLLYAAQLSSWGQLSLSTRPTTNGITAGHVLYAGRNVANSPGDGTGIITIDNSITHGNQACVLGMVQETSDPDGAWGFQHFGRQTGGTMAPLFDMFPDGCTAWVPLTIGSSGVQLDQIDTVSPGSSAMSLASNGPTVTSATPTNFLRINIAGTNYILPLWPV